MASFGQFDLRTALALNNIDAFVAPPMDTVLPALSGTPTIASAAPTVGVLVLIASIVNNQQCIAEENND